MDTRRSKNLQRILFADFYMDSAYAILAWVPWITWLQRPCYFAAELCLMLVQESRACICSEDTTQAQMQLPMYNKVSSKRRCLSRSLGFPGGSDGKESAYNVGYLGWIPRSGRSPGERNGDLLQHSCLENPMDRGAWWVPIHAITESDMTE